MKFHKLIILSFFLLISCITSISQDNRALNKKTTELLSHFPTDNIYPDSLLMARMISLGEFGLKQICDQVLPVGGVDDASPRDAIVSLSVFFVQNGNETTV
jgi:hypothetical protein